MTRMRKILQYFFIANKRDKMEMFNNIDDTTEDNEDNVVQKNINSFFEPYVLVTDIQDIKQKSNVNKKQQHHHHHPHHKMHSSHNSGYGLDNNRANDMSSTIELTNRLFYYGKNTQYNESMELLFFKLGYKPTFVIESSNLDTIIAQNFFDIVMIDNDDIIQIEKILYSLSQPSVKSAIHLLFLVSNNLNYAQLIKLSTKYGVHVILRKPLMYQDLHKLFKDIGLLLFV